MHIYDDAIGESLVGLTLDGNVAFNAGAIQNVRAYSGLDYRRGFSSGSG